MKPLALTALFFSVAAISLGCGREQTSSGDAEKYPHRDDPPAAVEEQAVASSEIGGPGRGLVKVSDPATAQRDAAECSGWVYREANLASDLQKMRSAEQEEWGRLCYQYSCAYEGNALVAGKLRKVTVNAGGWISLAGTGGEIKYFVSDKALPGFQASCDCCE